MHMPSGMQLLVIVLIVLILFGGKKIPELAKGLGSGIKNFKKAIKEDEDEVAQAPKKEEIEKDTQNNTTKKMNYTNNISSSIRLFTNATTQAI